MTDRPHLFDRRALERHRNRAQAAPALVLHDTTADDLLERVEEVNRTFTAPAVVTGWPQVWRDRLPDARIVRDDDALDLEPGAHDLVIHALALHWAEDPVGQLIQCRRALKPDGMMLCALFGGATLRELRDSLARSEAEIAGGLSPRIAPMGDIRDLGALLGRAGFALPVADLASYRLSYESAFALMADLRAMGETNALAQRLRHATRRRIMLRAAEIYKAEHAEADGRIPATFEVVTLTGWAPGPDQPKPLRPGSAVTRLADALGATEAPLDPSAD